MSLNNINGLKIDRSVSNYLSRESQLSSFFGSLLFNFISKLDTIVIVEGIENEDELKF